MLSYKNCPMITAKIHDTYYGLTDPPVRLVLMIFMTYLIDFTTHISVPPFNSFITTHTEFLKELRIRYSYLFSVLKWYVTVS